MPKKFFTIQLTVWVVTVLVLLFVNKGSLSAVPQTFIVTNTNDSGAGSLRQAIEDANNNGISTEMDTIAFNILGSDVHTIELASELPTLIQRVTIDGYSQTGAVANTATSPNPFNGTLKIEIKGNPESEYCLNLTGESNQSIIKGLSAYNCGAAGIKVSADSVMVHGNYFGVKADGVTPADAENERGVWLVYGSGNKVGGINPEERNIIAGYSAVTGGFSTGGDSNTEVYGNYFGIGKDGVTDLGTSLPVSLNADVTFGGTAASERNVVSGGRVCNMIITGGSNTVQGNYIGTDYTGTVNSSISNGCGINFVTQGAIGNLIGGVEVNQGNVIKGIGLAGVSLQEMVVTKYNINLSPTKNAVLGNSISDINFTPLANTSISETTSIPSNLGIDMIKTTESSDPPDFLPEAIENVGPNQNDSGDADTGANGLINHPLLKSAQQVGNQLTIIYDLDVADSPSDTYRVEFFANNQPSAFGYGPGEIYLGASTTATNGTNKTATLTVSGDFTNKLLSATTTAIDNTTSSGFGATSEFSKNISIASDVDVDADGASNAIENAAPNSGDGNNDGIQDSEQAIVTSYKTESSDVYVTLVSNGCSENGEATYVNPDSLETKDEGHQYPYGLTDFTLYCSHEDTADIAIYIHKDDDAAKYTARKYSQGSNSFSPLANANITKETVGNSVAIKLAYIIKDGSNVDADGSANGIIVDPVGLAVESSGVLANTGILTGFAMLVGVAMLGGVLYTYRDYRRHKKPLLEISPESARSYTYWHHLRIVSIPLLRYRLQIRVEKRQTMPSNGIS